MRIGPSRGVAVVAALVCGAAFVRLPAHELPAGWTASGETPRAVAMVRDCEHAREGRCSLRLTAASGNQFGAAVQTLSVVEYEGARVALSGWLRTEDAESAQLFLRVDGASLVVAFDNMGDRPVTGTSPWTEYRLAVPVPRGTSRLAFGVLLRGSGRLWADGFSLTRAAEDVASTDILPTNRTWLQLPGPSQPALPRHPVNLGFEAP